MPQSAFSPAWSVQFFSPPFVAVSSGNTDLPYGAAPSFSPNGPFFGQLANVSKVAVDSLQVDYIHT